MNNVRCLIDAATLQSKVEELGAQISADFAGQPLTVVPVLKGSLIFAADLLRHLDLDVEVDLLAVRSYGDGSDGGGTQSTGIVQFVHDLSRSIADKNVLLVEDIVDTGLTMTYLLDNLRTRRPRSLRLASLLHKPARTQLPVPIDYLGFRIEDVFVVGYGLDYNEKYRQLPYLAVLEVA